MVQISTGEFLLNRRFFFCSNVFQLTHLSKFQILSNIVANRIEFTIMINGEEKSIESLKQITKSLIEL